MSIDVGQRLGVDGYYRYSTRPGLKGKTGIDLSGETVTIICKKEGMGLVGLTAVSFGQSFQVTPIQLTTTAASIVNGENRVASYFGVAAMNTDQTSARAFKYPPKRRILSKEINATMRYVLEQIVPEGNDKKAKPESYKIGSKTAASKKLPRGLKKYASLFTSFAPADNPQIIALITIDEPKGTYYGRTIAASVAGDLFRDILPYPGVQVAEKETTVHASNL